MPGLDFATSGSMDWASLEKNLGKNVNTTKKNYNDDRFWKLSRDENDNGAALIRLIPDPEGKPFIQLYNHSFFSYESSSKKRWYINNSPQTIGKECPAINLWAALYNEGSEEGKLEAKNFSRGIQFYTNIKVIKDPANPQNEGKIFIWKFGTKLKDKIVAALNPSDTDRSMGEEPKELYNPLTGNNIKLKIQKAAGFLNYDSTTIEPASTIYENAEMAKSDILENATKLSEFNSPEAFETFEELSSKINYVLQSYTPKNLSPEKFKAIVDGLAFGVEKQQTETIPTTEVEAVETIVLAPEPEVIAQTTAVEDDLAFLDSL